MKSLTVACVTLGLALGFATTAAAQKGKTTGCGPDVYLNVTVAGTPANPNGYVLVSDGNESYNHGTPKSLVARFQVENCTQDFTLLLGNSRRTMTVLLPTGTVTATFFNLDRVASVPLTSDPNFLNTEFCTLGVVNGADGKPRKNADGSYQDNYAGCFVDELGVPYVRRAGGFTLDPDARLSFNVSPIDRPAMCAPDPAAQDPSCTASHVRVYHPTASQWVITPEPGAQAHYRIWSGGEYVSQGYESVPFRITATRR